MAALDDIREGIAANLFTLKTNGTVGHVSAYMQENPQTPSLHVVGVEPFDYGNGYGSDDQDWSVLVEAVIGRATDVGSQKKLNALLATSGTASLKIAAQADRTLTARMNDKGVVTAGHDPACQDLFLARYLGQSKTVVSGGEVLVAAWAIRVIA